MDPCLVADGSWTNEKHLHFLDFLESSFLHAMFGEGGGGKYGRLVGAPLDPEMPDSCDPTQDSRPHLRKKKTHLHKGTGAGIMNKPKKSMRSTTSKQRFDPSNDQVVPQLAERADGDDKAEERDHRQKNMDVGPK